MKTYDLSIIIPIFNTSIYLKKCIDSIISQQIFNNIELLLINDGSSDASEKICKEYCEKYNNIKYFYQKNQGVASARNLGLFNAKGEYIYFIDSDDTIANDFFMEFSNVNVKNKYDIVIVATDNFNQSKRSVSKITTCPTWGAIIRKKILEKHHIKFFTGLQNTEDNLFFYQLLTFTNSIYKTKIAKYNYTIKHSGNLSSKLNNQEYKKNVLLNLLEQVELFYEKNSKNSKIKDHTKRFLADMIFYQLLVSRLSINNKFIISQKLQKLIKKIGCGFTNKENLDFKLILFYTIFDFCFLT